MVDTMNKAELLEALREIRAGSEYPTVAPSVWAAQLSNLIAYIEAQPEPLAEHCGWMSEYWIGEQEPPDRVYVLFLDPHLKLRASLVPVRVVVYPVEPPA